ncbi:MAG: L-threonylcarbamoyladenylate synthase [Candidatus Aminicenantes bacterium]|nr:L-threonylcarbamoyladenylate synthase [Candidatus Aminicenantes bacterium]
MITVPFAAINEADNFNKIRDCIRADGVIVYPTDTLYGLGGNFYSPVAIEKIDRLKKRSDQPYSAAVGSLAMLEALAADIPENFRKRLMRLLPGKFTFIFKANPEIDRRLLKNRDTIGIRLPDLPLLLELIEKLALPLFSTSVNRSGRPPLNDPVAIAIEFPEVDLLIDGGILPPSRGSTIVDLTKTPPAILRPGADMDRLMSLMDR